MSAAHLSRRNRLPAGINLTSTMDMIFNILFFFVIIAAVRDQPRNIQVQLPASSTAAASQSEEKLPPTIWIDPAGALHFNDRTVVPEELLLELTVLARKGERAAIIQGDAQVSYERVVQAMDVCRKAGLTAIRLDMQPAGGGLSENNHGD